MIPNKKYSQFATVAIFGITAAVWVYSFSALNIPVRADEIAIFVLLFVVPAGLVSGATWIMLDVHWWRILLGILVLLPSIAIWVLSLMLVSAGFKIH